MKQFLVFHLWGFVVSAIGLIILILKDDSTIKQSTFLVTFWVALSEITRSKVFISLKKLSDKNIYCYNCQPPFSIYSKAHLFSNSILVFVIILGSILSFGDFTISFFTSSLSLAILLTVQAVFPILCSKAVFTSTRELHSLLDFTQKFFHKFSNIWESSLSLNLQLTFFGAWFGGLLLGLDWIVTWKVYPITSLVSLLIFNAAANLLSILWSINHQCRL